VSCRHYISLLKSKHILLYPCTQFSFSPPTTPPTDQWLWHQYGSLPYLRRNLHMSPGINGHMQLFIEALQFPLPAICWAKVSVLLCPKNLFLIGICWGETFVFALCLHFGHYKAMVHSLEACLSPCMIYPTCLHDRPVSILLSSRSSSDFGKKAGNIHVDNLHAFTHREATSMPPCKSFSVHDQQCLST